MSAAPVIQPGHDPDRAATRVYSVDTLAKAALLLVFAAVCALTWRKWGTLTVDCGREMYVPAVLSQGKRLYFDAWYPYGPLIPYWHALLFRMFGVHLWLLQTAGIVVAGVTTLLVYSLSRQFLPTALSFVAAFAFVLQAFQLNLFNYVQPYSYSAAYGAMAFVLFAWVLLRNCRSERPWVILTSGCLAGLAMLVKTEFGVAAFLLLAAAILVRALRSRSTRRLLIDAALSIPGLLLCAAVYGWYIHASSVEFLFGQNMMMLPDSYFMKEFGRRWTGRTGFTLSPLLVTQALAVGLLGLATLAATVKLASSTRAARLILTFAALALCALHLGFTYVAVRTSRPTVLMSIAPFVYFNRGMVLASALIVGALAAWRSKRLEAGEPELLLLAVASVCMGLRILTEAQPVGYSIYFDIVPFIAFLVALWKITSALRVTTAEDFWIPVGAVLCCGLMSVTAVWYPIHHRRFLVSSPRGSLYVERHAGQAFSGVLEFLTQANARSERFVVWPEEVALYFFTGETAPSRWYMVAPGILPPGELSAQYLADLDRQKVKYVVLSNRGTPEYGTPLFGIDYNQELYRWLQRNFHVVHTFGDYQRVPAPPYWAAQVWERNGNGEGLR